MPLPKEKDLEQLIEDALVQDGYIQGDPECFDRHYSLDPDMLLSFLEATQGDELAHYRKNKGANWKKALLDRISQEVKARGMVDVLRHGVSDFCLHQALRLAYFKPNSSLNRSAWEKYEKNILAVTRQVHYSLKNEKSLDMVLFLNGFPIVVMELKNPFTGQNVFHAMNQFRKDRDAKELIFGFNQRSLVCFAVDPDEVYMATHLKGDSTYFLPFNRGWNGGRGNAPVEGKMKTHYLWEEILTRENLLDIIKRFYFIETEEVKTESGKIRRKMTAIFPRYHQLDVVRKVEDHVKEHGAGSRYLIQHSAGSGKTKSISWLAHRLANLHDGQDKNIFDSIIVITDRKVLDRQLQEAIYQLEHEKGVVVKIDEGKTSGNLAEALQERAKIIITTVQKFPFALEKMDEQKKGRYAVIIDEAHSSTAGENMAALRDALAAKNGEGQEGEVDVDDQINALLERRTDTGHISFFAFTATPKNKTLQIFGTMGQDGKPHEFHLYSMRQAIEERFILDVLKNYTTYNLYYKIAKKIQENPEFEKDKAAKAAMKFVLLNEHNIRQKAIVMVEDFYHYRSNWLNGKAKGLVVTGSRLQAVKYKEAIDAYIEEKGYAIKTLVAFSGTVEDELGKYTEGEMNGIKESELTDVFDREDDQKLLVVAEKYQTGFDQPKLCVMYVDKVLSGVKAVQTLSRLNRTYPEKQTFVLDFCNTTEEIRESFAPYYEQTNVEEVTDPNLVMDTYYQVVKFHVLIEEEVDQFAACYFNQTAKNQQQMNYLTDTGIERFLQLEEDEAEEFRTLAVKYTRIYNFLIQIYPLKNPNLYKLHIYLIALLKKMPKDPDPTKVELDHLLTLDYYRLQQIAGTNETGEDISLKPGSDYPELPGFTDGGASRVREKEKEALDDLIERINKRFGTSFQDADRLTFDQMAEDFEDMSGLKERAQANSFDEFLDSFTKREFLRGVRKRKNTNQDVFEKILTDPSFKAFIAYEMAVKLYDKYRVG